MGVSSGRSRVADLSFQVFHRSLHPEWFATRAFRRVERQGWGADLRIIEGGHAVLFRSGSICLAEILSGPETVLPESGRLFHSHLRHERSTHLRPGGLIDYQSCVEVERVDLEIFRHLCEEMTLDTSRDSLFHRFRSANRLAPPPISSYPHRRPSQRPRDPVVPHLSRRMRHRPDPIPVRAESLALQALKRGVELGLDRRRLTGRITEDGCTKKASRVVTS